jgi:hypothetical protein
VPHAFGNAGACHYHDHLDDTNASLYGTIVVQQSARQRRPGRSVAVLDARR